MKRRKHLEHFLSGVQPFSQPKLSLEQYMTSAEIAASFLYTMDTSFDDLEDKLVADLGCGSAMLTVGACAQGASFAIGFDVDTDALRLSRQNSDSLDCNDKTDFVQLDVQRLAECAEDRWCKQFDVVIMNPPFGTKRNQGIDIHFLKAAINLSTGAVYSMHKTATREHIMKKADDWKVDIQVIAELRFDLPCTYSHHKRTSVDVDVDLIRLSNLQHRIFEDTNR